MATMSLNNAGGNLFSTTFKEKVTATEALHKCGADFEVGLQPIIVGNSLINSVLRGEVVVDSQNIRMVDGQPFINVDMLRGNILNDYKATMRMDTETPLGIVSDSYGVVQNQHAFDFMDSLIGSDNALITSAGSLLGGRRIYLQAKLPEPVKMAGNSNDEIEMYIIVSTSHDGSGAVNVCLSPIRVYCLNSLQLALSECEYKITFKHTSNVKKRMDYIRAENEKMAGRVMDLYTKYKNFYEIALGRLATVKLTDKEMEAVLVKSILPKDVVKTYNVAKSMDAEDISTRSRNIISGIMEANFTGVGQEYISEKNTGLSILNALTTFYQNNSNWGDSEKKYLAIHEGSVNQKVQNLYSNLIAMAV